MPYLRKRTFLLIFAALFLWYIFSVLPESPSSRQSRKSTSSFHWRDVPTKYPPKPPLHQLPRGHSARIPQIQASSLSSLISSESRGARQVRTSRLAAIKEAFVHSWSSYRKHAWLHDEVRPLTGDFNDPFGGWAATLVDSLDTLWIMNLKTDFTVAVAALNYIDFSTCESLREISTFETTIRYLGGFLAAYDLSTDKSKGQEWPILLEKAREVGDLIYVAMDNPSRMPIGWFDWKSAKEGVTLLASANSALAEVGSLTMEFARLSQITGDDKYFDAVMRIAERMEKEQMKTRVPGLWPVYVDVSTEDSGGWKNKAFSLGALADSTYEYLPKSWLLLHGKVGVFEDMYAKAVKAIKEYMIYEPLLPGSHELDMADGETEPMTPLSLGNLNVYDGDDGVLHHRLDPQGQHLTCFAGGMMALGSRIFVKSEERDRDMRIAERLTDGCVWAYKNTPMGVAPETYFHQACRLGRSAATGGQEPDFNGAYGSCEWSRDTWIKAIKQSALHGKDVEGEALEEAIKETRLQEGFLAILDGRYLLRPEAIESVFIMWRTTGDEKWRDIAWDMFINITAHTRTEFGYAALSNVMRPNEDWAEGEAKLINNMESFWMGETLKYFYLIFSDPALVSLDEYVLNTEAHPLRWRH